MPRDKDLKRLVRSRMRKTGEAYTAARAQILKKPAARPAPHDSAPVVATAPTALGLNQPTPAQYAALAGMTDAAIKAKTGCPWERWVRTLDRLGAAEMSHRDIVRIVHTKYKIEGWWAQTVTVGYERIKGLRARGQRRDGTYEATRSRTFAVPVQALFRAWADPAVRRRWLRGARVKVRTATAPKSMRLDWPDGGIIAVGFTAKGTAKSMVALSQARVPDRPTADRLKAFWSAQLDALGEVLSE
jgi:hypothetical protein